MSTTKKKAGRPLKIDEKIIRKLVEGFQNDFTIEEACRYADIGITTFYEQMKRDESFRKEMDAAQGFPFIVAKNRVFKRIKAGGPESANLALRFLERRQRDRYSPKIINEMTGDVTLGYGEIESAPKVSSPEEARKIVVENSNV